MKRPLEIIVPFLLLTFLSHPSFVYAADNDPIINIDIDVQGIIDAILGLGDNLGGILDSIPQAVTNVLANALKGTLINFSDPVLSLSQKLLTTNPDPSGLKPWWDAIILVISSMYLLLFLLIGFMFLFAALSPEKRMEAKEWLKNAFMMIILVNLSFFLYDLILQLSTAITQYMWIGGFETLFDKTIFNNAGATTLLVYALSVFLASITLFIRHVILLMGVVLFPIALFLYYIPPLQTWGKMILNFLGIYLFMQFIDVVIFVASHQTMLSLAGNEGVSVVPALAFLLIFIINVLLILYAGIKSAFTLTENSKVLSFAIGAMAGQITGAIQTLKTAQPKSKSEEVHVL